MDFKTKAAFSTARQFLSLWVLFGVNTKRREEHNRLTNRLWCKNKLGVPRCCRAAVPLESVNMNSTTVTYRAGRQKLELWMLSRQWSQLAGAATDITHSISWPWMQPNFPESHHSVSRLHCEHLLRWDTPEQDLVGSGHLICSHKVAWGRPTARLCVQGMLVKLPLAKHHHFSYFKSQTPRAVHSRPVKTALPLLSPRRNSLWYPWALAVTNLLL